MTNRSKNAVLSVIFFCLSCMTSCGQVKIEIPSEFVETIPPEAFSSDWYPLNSSQNEFEVEIFNNELKIKKIGGQSGRCELEIPNGKLIGIDGGEWGGKLTFTPNDTLQKTIKIKNGNIKFIFKFRDKIYFIEGLAHLSISEGTLYELNGIDNNFTYKKLIFFEDAPEAFTIYDDKFFVATHENFYIIDEFKKELIFKNIFWSSLYPNSIAVVDDKNIFIGIRSGIVKLNIKEKIITFYKYVK